MRTSTAGRDPRRKVWAKTANKNKYRRRNRLAAIVAAVAERKGDE